MRADSASSGGPVVVEGDARDVEAVGRAISGCDAVISILSLSSPEVEPEYSEVTMTIVDAANGPALAASWWLPTTTCSGMPRSRASSRRTYANIGATGRP